MLRFSTGRPPNPRRAGRRDEADIRPLANCGQSRATARRGGGDQGPAHGERFLPDTAPRRSPRVRRLGRNSGSDRDPGGEAPSTAGGPARAPARRGRLPAPGQREESDPDPLESLEKRRNPDRARVRRPAASRRASEGRARSGSAPRRNGRRWLFAVFPGGPRRPLSPSRPRSRRPGPARGRPEQARRRLPEKREIRGEGTAGGAEGDPRRRPGRAKVPGE